MQEVKIKNNFGKVIIYADSGQGIGNGHVMRCFSIARAVKEKGLQVEFICSNNEGSIFDTIEAEFPLTIMNDVESEIKPLLSSESLLIIDHYQIDSKLESIIRPRVKKLAIIDDLANRPHDCDFLIDHTPGRREEDYKSLVNKDATSLLGKEYMLLRSEFLLDKEEIRKRRLNNKSRNKVFINMGGVDGKNTIPTILEWLEELEEPLEINITISSSAKNLEMIKDFNSKHQINILVDHKDMPGIIMSCNWGIGAGGTNAWERCRLGLPSILFCVAENQEYVCSIIANENAQSYLGSFHEVDKEKFLSDANQLISNNDSYGKLVENSLSIVTDNPLQNILKELFSIQSEITSLETL